MGPPFKGTPTRASRGVPDPAVPFEILAAPLCRLRRGDVRRAEELEQRGVGIGRSANEFVGEQELGKRVIPSSPLRTDGAVAITGRLGVGVRVEVAFAIESRPVPGAADLARVRLQ